MSSSAPVTEEGFGFDMMKALEEVLVNSTTVETFRYHVSGEPSVFDATHKPNVGIRDYARRLQRYLYCTDECFIVSLVLLERILETDSSLSLNDLNVHRLLLASTTVAAKFQDDDFYSNPYYAKVGGVTSDEMINLETEFLQTLEWRAHVSVEEYDLCLKRLRDGSLSLKEVAQAKLRASRKEAGIDAKPMQLPVHTQADAVGPAAAPEVVQLIAQPYEVHVGPTQQLNKYAADTAPAQQPVEMDVGAAEQLAQGAVEDTPPKQQPSEMDIDATANPVALANMVDTPSKDVAPSKERARKLSAHGSWPMDVDVDRARKLNAMMADKQQFVDMDSDGMQKVAALTAGDHGTQCTAWTSQRRPRRRSVTPVTHLNVRRTRLCLVVH